MGSRLWLRPVAVRGHGLLAVATAGTRPRPWAPGCGYGRQPCVAMGCSCGYATVRGHGLQPQRQGGIRGCSPTLHLCGAESWAVAVGAMAVRAVSPVFAAGSVGLCAAVVTGVRLLCPSACLLGVTVSRVVSGGDLHSMWDSHPSSESFAESYYY